MNAVAAREPEQYRILFDPVLAARYLMNLTDDEEKVQVDLQAVYKDSVVVRITFAEENKTENVRMRQPWGEKGIWVPTNQ